MESVWIMLIVAVSVLIIALLVFILKNFSSPKKAESISKLIKQGKNQAAAKLAKQIIAKDPKNYTAHYYLGKAYMADNRGELALMEFKTINENALFDSNLPEVQFRKEFSTLLMKFGHNDEALRECLLLTKLEPGSSENYFNAGRIAEQQNRKAAEKIRKGICGILER